MLKFKVLFTTILVVLGIFSSQATQAACGAAFQRMEVGNLPDIFLNYGLSLELERRVRPGIGAPIGRDLGLAGRLPFGRELPIILRASDKEFDIYWTANEALPGLGDCNLYARVTIEKVGLASPRSRPMGAPMPGLTS